MDRDVHIPSDPIHRIHILKIFSGDTPIDLDVHASLLQQPDRPERFLKASGIMAQRFICFIICSIQSDIDPPRLLLSEKVRPFLIEKRAVCIDRKDHPHLPQLCIQSSEIRKQKRFAAGDQQKERSRLLHLPSKTDPFVCCMKSSTLLHLGSAESDITHITVHIAEREQFEGAVDRTLRGRGARQHHLFKCVYIFREVLHNSMLLSKKRTGCFRFSYVV